MKTTDILVLFIPVVMAFSFVILMLYHSIKYQKQFNSSVRSINKDYRLFIPRFKVEKIESSLDDYGNRIAKYTVINTYYAKENERDFVCQHFHFYDKVGQYDLGDEITLTKI